MTDRLDQLRALHQAATPGPWVLSDEQPADELYGPFHKLLRKGDVFRKPSIGYFMAAFNSQPADAELIVAAVNALLDLLDGMAALERIAEQQQKTLAMIQSNDFVFDSIGNEPGNWQHLAFSIYTDLCEVDTIARQALDRLNAG